MKNLAQIRNLIFDIDGTIWDTTKLVAAFFNEKLQHYPDLVPAQPITPDLLKTLFGKPVIEIVHILFPDLESRYLKNVMKDLLDGENEYLAAYQHDTYEGLAETMKKLSEDHKLFIVSNCHEGYIELCMKNAGIASYITDSLCPADTGLFKADNIRLLMERNHLDSAAYIGDTAGDQEACREAGVPFVWAAYGFGNVENPDARIQTPAGLLELFP